MKLLVIDDEDIILESIEYYFGRRNYAVCTALTGEKGLELLQSQNPDLLLLDLHMKEGIQGIEILEKALVLKPGLKVAILTGFGGDSDVREACLAKGAKAVLRKPLALNMLLEEVKKLLDS